MRKPLITPNEMILIIAEVDAAPYRKAEEVFIKHANKHNLTEIQLRNRVRVFKSRNRIQKRTTEKKIRKNVSHLYSWIQELKTEKH